MIWNPVSQNCSHRCRKDFNNLPLNTSSRVNYTDWTIVLLPKANIWTRLLHKNDSLKHSRNCFRVDIGTNWFIQFVLKQFHIFSGISGDLSVVNCKCFYEHEQFWLICKNKSIMKKSPCLKSSYFFSCILKREYMNHKPFFIFLFYSTRTTHTNEWFVHLHDWN